MKKCPSCNAIMEDDALFCGECGTKFEVEEVADQVEETTAPQEKKCIHCGETIEEDSAFCPYCGKPQVVEEIKDPELEAEKEPVVEEKTEPKQEENPAPEEKEEPKEASVQETPDKRPHYDWEDEPKSKKWIWILLVVLLVGAGAWYFFSQNGYSLDDGKTVTEAVDSTSVVDESEEYNSRKEFIESMYKDLFENKNFDTENISNLQKYLSPSVVEKIKMECPYEGGEGDFSYVVDFFRDGSLSYERPDYGDKVVSRTIEPEDNDWFLVTNIWDVIQTPVKVHLKVRSADGKLKIVDIKLDNSSQQDQEEVGTAGNLSDLISFAEILKTNGNFEELVKTHGFKSSVIDETSYYYKNCTVRDGKIVPTGEGSSILIRECLWPGKTYGYLTIEVFDDGAYKHLMSELESLYGSNYVDGHREFPAKWANDMAATFTIEGKASGGIFRLDEFYFE